MFDVLTITAPIFLLIALGFASTRLGWTSPTEARALGGFVLRFPLPALIFNALSQRNFSEIIHVDYLFAYTAGSLAAFGLMFAFVRLVNKADTSTAAAQALGVSSSNSGFMGFPIVLAAVGPAASVALAHNMVTENLVMLPLMLALAEAGKEKRGALFLPLVLQLVRNPLIIAMIAGAIASLSGLRLPVPIAHAVDMMAAASSPVALFAIGGGLVGLQIGGLISDIVRIAAAKLTLHPACVALALMLVPGVDPDLRKAMLIYAALPMASIFPLLVRPYGQEGVAAAALVAATSASFLTISALLMFL